MFTHSPVAGLLALLALVGAIAFQNPEVHSGKIMAVETDKVIVLNMADGESEVFAVTPVTKITRKGETIKVMELAMGESVQIVADTVETKLVAKTINVMPTQ